MTSQPLWTSCSSVWSPPQCFFSSCLNRIALSFSLCLLLLFLSLDNSEKSGSTFCTLSRQVFKHIDKIPPEPPLLQAEQSQLSQCFLIWFSSHFITVVATHRTHSSKSTSLFYQGAQTWTPDVSQSRAEKNDHLPWPAVSALLHWVCMARFFGEEGEAAGGEFCEKAPEAALMSDAASFNWLQNRLTAGQSWANQRHW